MQITFGSRVTMHFALTLQDGMVAESSYGEEPVTFVLGDGALDTGLERALIGLRPGDHQTLTLMPGQAFGWRDKASIQWLDKSQFPPDMAFEEGHIIGFAGADGEEVAGSVLEIQDDRVKVDFNHPLAGRQIGFEVDILEVENPPPQEPE
jgi:FKBP-type peptidyl-prolyl cis-trans isomerase SlpA